MKKRILASVLLLVGCSEDGVTAADASCGCAAESAEQTAYDNQFSGLGATNVQDGLDELAARPVPEQPIGERLEEASVQLSNPGTDLISAEASCPTPASDVALGGSCDPIPGAVLRGSTLINSPTLAGFKCFWGDNTGNTTDEMVVRVMCLHGAK